MFSKLAGNPISDYFKYFCLKVSLWEKTIPGKDQCGNSWYHYYLNTTTCYKFQFYKRFFLHYYGMDETV